MTNSKRIIQGYLTDNKEIKDYKKTMEDNFFTKCLPCSPLFLFFGVKQFAPKINILLNFIIHQFLAAAEECRKAFFAKGLFRLPIPQFLIEGDLIAAEELSTGTAVHLRLTLTRYILQQ